MLIPQSWTLSLELFFYILAPFILRRSIILIASLCVLSACVKMGLQFFFDLSGDPWSYRFFPSELSFFLLGALGARFFCQIKLNPHNGIFVKYVLVAGLLVASTAVNRSGFNTLYFINPGFYLMFIILIGIPFLFRLTMNNKFDKIIGELSYPLYISHMLVISICGSVMRFDIVENKNFIIFFAVCFSLIL